MTRPIAKRTRNHVVVRFTPDQAKSLASMLNGHDHLVPARHANRLKGLACKAAELAASTPPPSPKPNSIKRGQNLRKGSTI